MAEQIVLTKAQVIPEKVTTSYSVVTILLDKRLKRVMIHLQSENFELIEFEYLEDEAVTFIEFLNKSVSDKISLERRILERILSDNKLEGTVVDKSDTVDINVGIAHV